MDDRPLIGHNYSIRILIVRILSLVFLLLISCSGYKIQNQSNPFKQEGINSIAVPMFINKTNLQSVSNTYSQAVISMLSKYRGLKVSSTNIYSDDAVLIGIIEPIGQAHEAIKTKETDLLSKNRVEAIGARSAFTLETIKRLSIRVRVLVLKKPKKEEIDFLINYFDFKKEMFPRSVFSRTFDLNADFSVDNTIGDNTTSAPVRGTRNKSIEQYSVENLANTFAKNLKGIIDNAF